MATMSPEVEVIDDNVRPLGTPDPKIPQTPSKRAAKTNSKGTPTSKKTKTTGDAKAIPTTVKDLNEVDKTMIRLKEEGMSWANITKELEKMTGTTLNRGSLAARYPRLKAALARVDPAHVEQLKKIHVEVANEIEEEIKSLRSKFWNKVGEKMEHECGEKYQAGTLEKEWKKMTASGTAHNGDLAGED